MVVEVAAAAAVVVGVVVACPSFDVKQKAQV